MELQNNLLEEKKKSKKNTGKQKKQLEQDSIQYNSQDLDQEQKVDVNPLQLNTQNLHIHLDNISRTYCGKITGTVYMERNKRAVTNVNILLYFGHESQLPVYKTNSDINGNFTIEDLPAGYYVIHAEGGENLKYRSHYIKVLPGQNVHQSILLSKPY